MPATNPVLEASRRILRAQAKSTDQADGVWRTTKDGSRIFIDASGEARAGGPKGEKLDAQASSNKTEAKPRFYLAADMPADMEGEVEIYDPDSGQSFDVVDASAARQMFVEQMAEYGNLDGLAVRPFDKGRKAQKEKEEKEFWDKRDAIAAEARRQEELATPRGLREGHKDFVKPPETLYHATFNAKEILQDGFKSGDDLGKQVLGGTSSNLVSFTTKENAEIYRNGLADARLAARGEMTEGEMIQAATKYGVTEDRARKLMIEAKKDRAEPSMEFFQRVAMDGKKFPLFMGGTWPENLKTAKPPEIVAAESSGVEDLYYNPGETEWRVGDYRKLKPKKTNSGQKSMTVNLQILATSRGILERQAKSCGANAQGGGGFQPGNNCAQGDGGGGSSGSGSATKKPKPAPKKETIGSRVKKWFAGEPKAGEQLQKKLTEPLDDPNLKNAEKFRQAIEKATSKMPDKVAKLAMAGVENVEFFDTARDLTKRAIELHPEMAADIPEGSVIAGLYTEKGQLLLNGGKETGDNEDATHGTYLHELVHAMDPGDEVAFSDDWLLAWGREMRAGQLTEYGASSPVEGLAEFGRVLYDNGDDAVREAYPRAYNVFKSQGWTK